MNKWTSVFITGTVISITALIIWNEYQDKVTPQKSSIVLSETQSCDYQTYEDRLATYKEVLNKQAKEIRKLRRKTNTVKQDNCAFDEEGNMYAYKAEKDAGKTLVCYFDQKARTWKKEFIEFTDKLMNKP